MTAQQPKTKKRPILLIIIAIIIGICALCIITSLAMDALGLLPETTPQPTGTPLPTHTPKPTNTPVPTIDPIQTYLDEYGGNIEVYQRIFAFTDCTLLQQEFDQADANLTLQQPGTPQYKWGIGYMNAADTRMKAIGCY